MHTNYPDPVPIRKPLFITLTVSVLLLLTAVIAAHALPVTYAVLFRDLGAGEELPVSHGIYSQIGLICWSLAAGALLLKLSSRLMRWDRERSYTLFGLLLTVVLGADDGFRIHESVFADALGWDEKVAFALYGLATVAYLLTFRQRILRSPWPFLLIALGCFAGSILVDLKPGIANYVGRQGVFLFEDGLKLTGIIFWLGYHLLSSRQVVRRREEAVTAG